METEKNNNDFLQNLKKDNPYKVPAGYFEQNAMKLKSIAQQEKPVVKIKPMRYLLAVAATLVIAFFVFNPNKKNTDVYLSQQDVLALVEHGDLIFDDYELASNFEIENLDWTLADELPRTQETEEPPYYLEEYLLNY